MPLDLVRDVFEPVAKHVKSEYDSHRLRDFLDEEYPGGVPPNAGLERNWFKDEVLKALSDVDACYDSQGPDIVLRTGSLTKRVELRAAYDLNTSDHGTTPRRGVIKHRNYPEFAGCIFLGRCFTTKLESKIVELTRGEIILQERLTFEEGEHAWIVGLLTARKN